MADFDVIVRDGTSAFGTRVERRRADAGVTLVTGGTGFLGTHFVRALLAEGRRVRVLSLDSPGAARGLAGLDVEQVRGDVRDAAAVRRAAEGAEVVYHLAAVISLHAGDEPVMRAVNVGGTRNVVRACRAAGVRRLVHVSSIHALAADATAAVVDETRGPARDLCVPAYDRSKAAADEEVRRGMHAGLSAVTIHPTGILGPLDFCPSHLGRAIVSACRGRAPLAPPGGFNWVDARDVAATLVKAERRGRRPRYVLGGRWTSLRDLYALAAAAAGARPPWATLPRGLLRAAATGADTIAALTRARPALSHASLHALSTHRNVSHDAAAADLGHAPRPLEETVAETVRWFRATGMLG